jgi:trans-2,3-dihydro-3-hydroxyanthranilate isomerase
MPDRPFLILDVFTDRALAGNQLAVFTDATAIDDALLQPLAAEMAYSETTFLYPPQGGGTARLRIFTPRSELPFAGHPVLGSAVAVAMAGGGDRVTLETPSGAIPVDVTRTGPRTAFGRMAQPVPTVRRHPHPGPILAALGVESSELPVDVYDNGVRHVYVTLPDPADVANLRPDMNALVRLATDGPLPVVGTSAVAGDGEHWTLRMFAPAEGIPEDAATGSAAGPLAVHLARHGRIAWGREITISQGAAIGRPSTLHAAADGAGDVPSAVHVSGSAVLVAEGAVTV